MSRRVNLPRHDEIFRPTAVPDPPDSDSDSDSADLADRADLAGPGHEAGQASGRVRHDEKMTVYVTAGELLDLEQARLTLRGRHGIALDRGRLVREAVALVLADLTEQGEDSPLVRRLAAE